MKYKVLLCGKSKSIIDDFFTHLDSEFEAQSTSLRMGDIVSHLNYFSPDVLVFCMHNESTEAFNSMVTIASELEPRRIPLIIIGNELECEEFQRATYYMAKLVLKKPMRIYKIGEKVLAFLEKRRYLREKGMDEDDKSNVAETVKTVDVADETETVEETDATETTEDDEVVESTDAAKEAEADKEATDTAEIVKETESSEATDTANVAESESVADTEGDAKKQDETPSEKKQEEQPPAKKHVLVVDDDPMMLKLIREQLKDTYTVATAISGNLALKFLENKKTDLVILDYEMPDENGAEVLKKIRDNDATSNLPVVFLTGISDREKIQNVLSFKPQGYLLKPIEREKLLQIIADTIE